MKLPDPSLPPKDPSLMASKQSLEILCDPAYWRKLCPQLHVLDSTWQKRCAPFAAAKPLVKETKKRVNEDGYTQVPASALPWASSIEDLALGVVQLTQHGWPGAFLSMYDEAWAMAHQVSGLMKAATGNENNMDMLAWYVDPNAGGAGFSPHRDRQPDDSPATFREDGTAKYATCWIPFTDAVPDNSCLYVVPRGADPGYFEGDDDDDDLPDPLSVALASKEAYQHIKALPAPAGSAVIFTHRIIHWGSRGRKGHPTPRISFSFGAASDDYEPPYLSRANLPFPSIQLRASLSCAQMIIYHERFVFSKKMLSLFHACFKSQEGDFDPEYARKNPFKSQEGDFDPEYARKVRFELVGARNDLGGRRPASWGGGRPGEGKAGGAEAKKSKAGKDKDKDKGKGKAVAPAPAAPPPRPAPGSEDEDDESDDDLEDDVLDAMLDAKMAGGGGDFEDDFDELEEGEEGLGDDCDDEDEEDDDEEEGEGDRDAWMKSLENTKCLVLGAKRKAEREAARAAAKGGKGGEKKGRPGAAADGKKGKE